MTAKMPLLEERIAERMEPYREMVRRLCEIPGIQRLTAWMVISEIGVDMSRFPTAGHLAAGAVCVQAMPRAPANGIPGVPAKATAMCGGHWCRQPGRRLASTANGRFSPRCSYRISSRAGSKKAAVAVAHRLLCVIYSMILTGSSYREQGADYFDRLHPDRTKNRLTAGLERLGFLVTLAPKPLTQSS